MKFSVLKENLSKALLVVNRTIPAKPQLPILSNILIKSEDGHIKIVGTNLETGIVVSVGAKIETPGEITVPGKLLTEFVSSLPSEKIDVVLEKEILRVKTNTVSAGFNTITAKEFPPFPLTKPTPQVTFSVKELGENISRVAFAASIDEGRPVLTGIKMRISSGKIHFYATDGYRLSIVSDKLESKMEDTQLIFPAKTLVEVIRIAVEEKDEKVGLFLSGENNQAIFVTSSTQIVTRLIDGEFPNVEKIIPATFKTRIVFDRENFLQSVKIASLFARGASNIIKMKIGKDGVNLMANTPQVGENQDFLDVKVEGEETEIAFNYRFLLDLLNNFSDKQIAFESSGSLNPGVFKPVSGSSSFLHIIMPVRLQG